MNKQNRLAVITGIAASLGNVSTPYYRNPFNEPRYRKAKPESFDEFRARHAPYNLSPLPKQPDTSGYGYAKKQRAASRRRKKA